MLTGEMLDVADAKAALAFAGTSMQHFMLCEWKGIKLMIQSEWTEPR